MNALGRAGGCRCGSPGAHAPPCWMHGGPRSSGSARRRAAAGSRHCALAAACRRPSIRRAQGATPFSGHASCSGCTPGCSSSKPGHEDNPFNRHVELHAGQRVSTAMFYKWYKVRVMSTHASARLFTKSSTAGRAVSLPQIYSGWWQTQPQENCRKFVHALRVHSKHRKKRRQRNVDNSTVLSFAKSELGQNRRGKYTLGTPPPLPRAPFRRSCTQRYPGRPTSLGHAQQDTEPLVTQLREVLACLYHQKVGYRRCGARLFTTRAAARPSNAAHVNSTEAAAAALHDTYAGPAAANEPAGGGLLLGGRQMPKGRHHDIMHENDKPRDPAHRSAASAQCPPRR
jgi:hypothetical protein